MAASVGGQSIIACRQKDGSLKAFYNVCKHRGHELLSGHGNTSGSSVPTMPGHMIWTANSLSAAVTLY